MFLFLFLVELKVKDIDPTWDQICWLFLKYSPESDNICFWSFINYVICFQTCPHVRSTTRGFSGVWSHLWMQRPRGAQNREGSDPSSPTRLQTSAEVMWADNGILYYLMLDYSSNMICVANKIIRELMDKKSCWSQIQRSLYTLCLGDKGQC